MSREMRLFWTRAVCGAFVAAQQAIEDGDIPGAREIIGRGTQAARALVNLETGESGTTFPAAAALEGQVSAPFEIAAGPEVPDPNRTGTNQRSVVIFGDSVIDDRSGRSASQAGEPDAGDVQAAAAAAAECGKPYPVDDREAALAGLVPGFALPAAYRPGAWAQHLLAYCHEHADAIFVREGGKTVALSALPVKAALVYLEHWALEGRTPHRMVHR